MTNRIVWDNCWARFHGPERDTAWLCLSYRKPGYYHSKLYKDGKWDGYIRMMHKAGEDAGIFPSGLVSVVRKEFAKQQLELEVIDHRQPPLDRLEFYCEADLMEHQRAAIDAAVRAERGIVDHATASGKSWTEVGLAAALQQRTLILTHRKDILVQLAETFKEHIRGGTIGIIGDGKWRPGDITIATFQSVWSKLSRDYRTARELLTTIGCIIVDEGHHISASTFETVLKHTPLARYRFGFSGTPFRSGDEHSTFHVQGWTGPVIHTVTPSEGVNIGRLVPADIFMLNPTWQEPDLSGLKWKDELYYGLLDNDGRNEAIIKMANHYRQAGPVLILVDRITHGEQLSRRLKCPFLRGETALNTRNKHWAMLRDGELDCVVASRIADEGIDIPGIQFLIMAGGGKARHVLIQRIGRGMRASVGKERLFVFDFNDPGRRLGAHSRNRRYVYRSQSAYQLTETTLEEVTP